jgi:hypothetical protein
MATQADDDDPFTAPVPEPEVEPTASELAHARRFAELVDKTSAGRTLPAIAADHRALIEVATVIRATHGTAWLAPSRLDAAVEHALRAASPAARAPEAPVAPPRRSAGRTPWLVSAASAVVAAAAIALWLHAPSAPPRTAGAPPPAEWTSRPADPLVGPIARDHAGDAEARIDALFADRLDGFRTRRLQRGSQRGAR